MQFQFGLRLKTNIRKLSTTMLKLVLQKHELVDSDYVFYLNKSILLPFSLTLFKNDLILLNNELAINFLDLWTIDKGHDSNRTGKKTFLRMPRIIRSKLCEIFFTVSQKCQTLSRDRKICLAMILFKNLQSFEKI